MRDSAPQTIYLKDYKPFGFLVDDVHLTFALSPNATRVKSRITFRPNPDAADREYFLHGEGLKLISSSIDGAAIDPVVTDRGLTADVPDAPFIFECDVEIDPANNTALEGLYMSNGMYCTQCEAEGFRKITFYPDRPDVMSVFTVRIEGNPLVLLSNGNPQSSGDGWAQWHDPWPKPAYLFALVAGDLRATSDTFTTASGKAVDLNVWVRPGDEGKTAFAVEALKKSMTWDEKVYGREYDLDVFNIVAVDDFNMGAMENKGLNVFNSSAVLASPETSTDMNFERIEAIIAHEYFHNWTGNRITCRDWFQLCLKEGLTVFRDAQFTSDMRSEPVKRIGDVIDLRARQFPEDNGPLAHPVRPESFQEINNFYTATVYEKGAEVIGMLKRLVGDDTYKRALDLYFERHDGQACTIEDWLQVFEDVSARDLTQFKRWYSQAGTPRVSVSEEFEGDNYRITFTQRTPPSVATPEPKPHVIPVAFGALDETGQEIVPTQLLELTEASQTFVFEGFDTKPIPSILRGFSAPVIVQRDVNKAERTLLLAHDTDPFNRWESAYHLGREARLDMVADGATPDGDFLDALCRVVRDTTLDPAFRSLVLQSPGQSDLAQALHDRGVTPDPQAIFDASQTMTQALAERLADDLPKLYAETTIDGPYKPDAKDAGKRSLNGKMLELLSRLDGGQQAAKQFESADNMTLSIAALASLLKIEKGGAQSRVFFDTWNGDRLVMDKWFSLQVICAAPDKAAMVARELSEHALFDLKNPNRFRATLGALAMNHAGFHAQDGSGYSLLADFLIRLDPLNPQTTARMCAPFQTWRRYDDARQNLIQKQLERIAALPGLSRDTSEMVPRIRAA